MSVKGRAHFRSNLVGYLALIVALSGSAIAANGSLAGRNTVGSADIINDEVKDKDIAADAVSFSELADESIGTQHLFGIARFEGAGISSVDDPTTAGSTDIQLLNVNPFSIVGRCTDSGGGNVKSEIILQGSNAVLIDADTNFGSGGTPPTGASDVTGVAANTHPVLASFGPTTAEHFGTGSWAAHNPSIDPITGNLAIGVNVNGDCTFSANVLN
jgi:hypothetical protein